MVSNGRVVCSIVVLFLVVFLQYGCSEKQAGIPELTVSFPSDGATYNVKDTIFIGVEASDTETLEYVEAKLISPAGSLASTVATANLNTPDFNGTLRIILQDKYLESGAYSLNVKANNGTNDSYAFVDINVLEFPKIRRSIYAVTGTAPSNAKLERVDSLGTVSTSYIFSHDASNICIDNRNNQAIVAGSFDGDITSINLENSTVNWSASSSEQPPVPTFLEMFCYDNNILISAYDHLLLGYDLNGSLIMNYQTTANYRPAELYVINNHLIVEQAQAGTTNNFMFHFNRNSLAFQNQLSILIDVVAICPFDDENVLLFGNENGQARVFKYSFLSNSLWEPRLLGQGMVSDAVKGDGNTYFIAQSDGIYAYTYSPNFLNQIVPGVNSSDIEFDVDRGVLLAAVENRIEEYTTVGFPVSTHQMSDNVVSFHIHYTK